MLRKHLGEAWQALCRTWREGDAEPPALRDEDLAYIASARAAVMAEHTRGGRQLLWVICACCLSFLLWASFTAVDEFTRGEGKVIPSQQVQIIQNLEGGILAELYVREGDSVQRHQAIARLDDTRFASSMREAGVTLDQLQLQSARLRAEATGTTFSPDPAARWDEALEQQELALYRSRQEELRSNREVLEQQVMQRQQEVSELLARAQQLEKSVALLEAELRMTRPLVAEGAVSEVELLRLERQLNDLQGERDAARLKLPRAQSSLKESREKLSNITIVFQREARQELNDITLELSRLTETSEALADRVKRTVVTSPVAGTVKRLLVNTIGGVIQPGMDIAEIVPSEEILLIEARVRPADIAYLHPGQTAKVKFTAYDFAIMGGLDGTVVHISPDTITDEQNETYYLVRVETARQFIGPDGKSLPIIPGMTVSVDVLTGEKTILDYLLKPILKTRQLALRER